jgi:Xaa-Pro aminopeptidase
MNTETIKKRTRAICQQLIEEKTDCLIATNPSNVTYITAFSGTDSWALITQRQIYLLTDSRFTEQAEKECVGCTIIQRDDSQSLAEVAAKLIIRLKPNRRRRAEIKPVQKISIEKSTTLVSFKGLRKNIYSYARLLTDAGRIESLRSIKDSNEITCIKLAARVATKALKQTICLIKPGITENELAGLLDFQIRKLGAKNSFETIVAFGPNASRPHHQPGAKRLKQNDTILIDFGAKYKGYCCDITRCFVIGKPDALYKRVYNVVEQAQAAAIKMVKAGVEIRLVDAAAREVIAKNDLPVYGHGTGHGFGLEIHELPFIKASDKGRFQAGQIITIEPGIYIPGKLGVRIEDDVLVTENGCKVLTKVCPHGPFLNDPDKIKYQK